MNIPVNADAPVKSIGQIEIDAPMDTVWQVLTTIEKWPEWQENVTQATISGKPEEGALFTWKAGGLTFKSRIHTLKPESMFGWTGMTFGAFAVHNWRFMARSSHTLVIVEESLQGVFPLMFRRYFQKSLDSGLTTNLEALKETSELMNGKVQRKQARGAMH